MDIKEENNLDVPESSKRLRIAARKMSASDKVQKRFRIFITVVFGAIACSVAIMALRSNIVNPFTPVKYDSTMMIRVGDVSRVYTIKRDPKENKLWVGAQEGIHSFNRDTYEWHRYGPEHGLPSEWTYDLCFFDNTLWAATDHGPAVLDKSSGRFRPLLPGDTSRAYSIENAGDSMAVVYSNGEGLIFFRSAGDSTPEKLDIPGLKPNHMITCLRYLNSRLYIGTELQELFSWDPVTGKSKQFHFDASYDGEAQVLDVLNVDSSLWVATSLDGVYKTVTPDSLVKLKSFPCKGAFVLCEESDGLWVGTPWGLWRYHKKVDAWVQFVHPKERDLGDFQVIALFADSQELWYGTSSAGAGYFNKDHVVWNTMRAGLSSPNVAAITCSDSAVYTSYGYAGGYIDKFSLDSMQYSHNINYNNNVADPNIQSLMYHGSRLYFGGFEGFGYLDFVTGRSRYYRGGGAVQAFDVTQMEFGDTVNMLGTVYGLVRYFPENDSFAPCAATVSDRVTCFYRQGSLVWYGTLAHGLKLYDLEKDSLYWTILEKAYRIIGITPVHYKGRDLFFVATDRSGFYMADPASGNFTQCELSKDVALNNPNVEDKEIRCMVKADSLIWLGTENAGCFVFDPAADKWGSLTYYEGLLNERIRSFCDTDRFLFIGSYGGIHRIDKRHKGLQKAIFGS